MKNESCGILILLAFIAVELTALVVVVDERLSQPAPVVQMVEEKAAPVVYRTLLLLPGHDEVIGDYQYTSTSYTVVGKNLDGYVVKLYTNSSDVLLTYSTTPVHDPAVLNYEKEVTIPLYDGGTAVFLYIRFPADWKETLREVVFFDRLLPADFDNTP